MTISTVDLIRINIARRKAGKPVLSPMQTKAVLEAKPFSNDAPSIDYLLSFDDSIEVDTAPEPDK